MAAGSKRRRGNAWELTVDIGADPATGRRRRHYGTFTGGARDADRRLRQLVEVAENGELGGVYASAAVGQIYADWDRNLDVRVRTGALSPSTVEGYRTHWRYPELQRIVPMKMQNVTEGVIGRIADEAVVSGRTPNGVRAMLRSASAMFSWAARRDPGAVRNPVPLADRPALQHHVPAIPEEDDLPGILDAAAALGPPQRLLVLLALVLGARRSELVALRWGAVDLDSATIRVDSAEIRANGAVVRKRTKEPRTGGAVPIDDVTVDQIHEYRSWWCSEANREPLKQDAVFPAFRRRALPEEPVPSLTPDWASQTWGRIRRDAGLELGGIHCLRHAMVTLALEHGVPLPDVAARVRHASPTSTSTIYAHVTPRGSRRAADMMGEIVHGDR